MIGFAATIYGVWQWSPSLAWIVVGLSILSFSVLKVRGAIAKDQPRDR